MRTTTELRTEILAAARVEFARHGLAGARIDRIARAAHASKERLYAHFRDKETLFREVLAADAAAFYRAATPRPEAVEEFVGDIYDLACRRPEHLRMIDWARLEGFALGAPELDGQPLPAHAIAAIDEAQAAGRVDTAWRPDDLLVLLFAIGLAWAHLPDPGAIIGDPEILAHRRAVAVEAAGRLISPRG